MEATYFLHHKLSLSNRPSLATHRSPSCHGHQHNLHVLSFHKNLSFHGLTQMGMSAKHSPSSLTTVACSYAAKEDDNNYKNQGRPLKRTLQRAYSFNTLTKGSEALGKFLNLQERALARDPSESANEFRQNLMCRRCDPEVLQELAWELEMSGEEENAVQMLVEKLSYIEREEKLSDIERVMPLGEEALNLRRLLVELLIYQGKYYHAKVLCESLIGKGKPSLKSYLYLAVIYQLMGDTENSKDMWDTFKSAYSGDNLLGSQTPSTIPILDRMGDDVSDVNATLSIEGAKQFTEIQEMNFTDFQNHIEGLSKEIKRGRDNHYKKKKAPGTKILSLELHINDEFLSH